MVNKLSKMATNGRTKDIYSNLKTAMDVFKKMGGLPDINQASEVWKNVWYLEVHNSTAIEGNTLALREVELLLSRNRTVGGKELKNYLEVKGYAKALQWVYMHTNRSDLENLDFELITKTEVRRIHELALGDVWAVHPHPNALPSETAGNFREHNINPFEGGMTPPDFTDVSARLSTWVSDTNIFGEKFAENLFDLKEIIYQLAQIHCKFEKIHPFLDGNGRTGRLILSLILIRMGFPPIIILKQRRNAYITAMEYADLGKYDRLAKIIAQGVIDNIYRFLTPVLTSDQELVPIHALAGPEISQEALRKAAMRGRLNASVGKNGTWYSSKQAVKKYLSERYRP
ncbi:MAG: Fic family protein [Bifidobacteriaceae bacterium]|jgi:Fic family protein|nr:Fic family protein [Bifidobacteriaceae bacterium]